MNATQTSDPRLWPLLAELDRAYPAAVMRWRLRQQWEGPGFRAVIEAAVADKLIEMRGGELFLTRMGRRRLEDARTQQQKHEQDLPQNRAPQLAQVRNEATVDEAGVEEVTVDEAGVEEVTVDEVTVDEATVDAVDSNVSPGSRKQNGVERMVAFIGAHPGCRTREAADGCGVRWKYASIQLRARDDVESVRGRGNVLLWYPAGKVPTEATPADRTYRAPTRKRRQVPEQTKHAEQTAAAPAATGDEMTQTTNHDDLVSLMQRIKSIGDDGSSAMREAGSPTSRIAVVRLVRLALDAELETLRAALDGVP